MNANQAQAGINRLLQLGETSTTSRPAPSSEGSVNERSFDQHMRQLDAREARSRPEPSKPRRDDERPSPAENERAVVKDSGRAASGVEPRATVERKQHEAPEASADDPVEAQVEAQVEAPVEAPVEEVAQDGVVDDKVTTVDGSVETTVEFKEVESDGAEAEALPEWVADTLSLEGPVDKKESAEPVGDVLNVDVLNVDVLNVDVLNGGVLSDELLSSDLNLGESGDDVLVEEVDALALVTDGLGPVDVSSPILADTGKVLPATPAQVAETVAAVFAPALPYKAGLESRAQTSAAVPVSSNLVSAQGDILPLTEDISLSGDAKVTSKTTVTALLGEQNGVVKPAATMTPQADQWFKQLAREAKAPELRSTPTGSVAGPAVADMSRVQSRIVSPMAAQGAMGPLQTQVKTPFGEGQWGGAIAERVAFLASQRVSAAEIHLNPAELGPIQVRVTLNQEQASVSFVAQHAVVREALDQGAFRLREMLDAEGLDLVDVDVSDQSFAEQDSEARGGGGGSDDDMASDAEEQPVAASVRTSLVDHFV